MHLHSITEDHRHLIGYASVAIIMYNTRASSTYDDFSRSRSRVHHIEFSTKYDVGLNDHQWAVAVQSLILLEGLCIAIWGHSIITSRSRGEGGGVPGVTLCDREGGGGRGSVTYASKKNVV